MTTGNATVNLSWLHCTGFIFIYLFILQVSEYTPIGCYFNKISGELFNNDARKEKSQKAIYYQADTRLTGKGPEFNSKDLNSLLAYACATLGKHNENKIRGKVVISLESVTRFLVTSGK